MQEIQTEHAAELGEVSLLLVDEIGYESGIPDLVDGVTLPVLQDTSAEDVFSRYGATKWYVYLIDRAGYPRYIHYTLDLEGEADRARLLSEIATLVAEPAP